jgi:hypothetical protein
MFEQWAKKMMGKPAASASPADVKVVQLKGLDDAARAQLKGWGKQRPPVPGNPPSWVDDEGAWERAKEAVKKNWGNYDEPWAVVAHVYQNMTGG